MSGVKDGWEGRKAVQTGESGLGHGGRQHSPDEFMTVGGLRDFEKFAATFLDLLGR